MKRPIEVKIIHAESDEFIQVFEVVLSKHKEMVQALPLHCSDPAFGVSVHVRGELDMLQNTA